MIALARVNGRQYMVDESGDIFSSKGLCTKFTKVKVKSIFLKKLIKRMVDTMKDRSERYQLEIKSLRAQIDTLDDKLDEKSRKLRELKADFEDKVNKKK